MTEQNGAHPGDGDHGPALLLVAKLPAHRRVDRPWIHLAAFPHVPAGCPRTLDCLKRVDVHARVHASFLQDPQQPVLRLVNGPLVGAVVLILVLYFLAQHLQVVLHLHRPTHSQRRLGQKNLPRLGHELREQSVHGDDRQFLCIYLLDVDVIGAVRLQACRNLLQSQPHLLPLDLALELWKPLIHKALPLRERRHVLALRGFFLNVVVSAHSVPQGSNLILHLLVPLRLDLMIRL
mmetsp:Transcript_10193/g.25957  ORF Transcript_10193/g.25957 Transcript_10193/m.25957 type:complete len:235 (-) Transcript_10193:221-925(-)